MKYKLQLIISLVVTFGVTVDAIAGGVDADIKDFPYTVSLRSTSGHYCGGSIINDRYILTACHCIDRCDKRQIQVVAGTSLRRSVSRNGQVFGVTDMKCHEGYQDFPKRHDIALIRVDRRIKLNSYAKIIDLPKSDTRGVTEVVISGWGKIKSGVEPRVLQKLDQITISFEKCKKYYPITDLHLCTFSKNGEGHCEGDSGGPVVSREDKTLVGIMSVGSKFCGNVFPDINTKVYDYLDWIKTKITEFDEKYTTD